MIQYYSEDIRGARILVGVFGLVAALSAISLGISYSAGTKQVILY